MKPRISQLWKVPVFCVAAGYLGFYLSVYAYSALAITVRPDGTATFNDLVGNLLLAALFLITLAIGYFLFRKLTKVEILLSAGITSLIMLILQLIQLFFNGSAFDLKFGMILVYLTQWSSIISQLCYLIRKNAWVGAFVVCLAPFVFVPFGKTERIE